MPEKTKSTAGHGVGNRWTEKDLAILRRNFSAKTNRDLAKSMGRSIKAIIGQGNKLGLRKSHELRSDTSRRTALNTLSREHMRAIGAKGGKIGGYARAEALSPARRKRIAKAAIAARWSARDSRA